MKKRLDVHMAEQGLSPSREKARALVIAGLVLVDGKKALKPSMLVDAENDVSVRQAECAYVSRGGLKLQKALRVFGISVADSTAVDIGASTGGFTDCLLRHGAKKVYAVDVGYGQLDWRLRNDERVVVMERTNARHLAPERFGEQADICVIDVSFISLRLILPAAKRLLKENGDIVALVKPQFEAGREQVGKRGVVRDAAVHAQVLRRLAEQAKSLGLAAAGIDYSPVKGPKGNIEFIMRLKNTDNGECIREETIKAVVDGAHLSLE